MGVRELPVRVIRYGRDAPLPERRELRAGPLTATLEDGALRYVRLGGHEVVRAIYAAVRDHNWGTVEPRFLAYSVDAGERDFRVTLPGAPTSVQLLVTRLRREEAVHVPLVVVDRCGDWPTFVGAGPRAF